MAIPWWSNRNRRLTARSRCWGSRAPSWCSSDWRGRHSDRCRHCWRWSLRRHFLGYHSRWRGLFGRRRDRSRYLSHRRPSSGRSNRLGDNDRNRRLYCDSRSRGDNFGGCGWRDICALPTASTATATIAARRTRWRCCRRWTNGRRNSAWGWGNRLRSCCRQSYHCIRSRNYCCWCRCFHSSCITSSTAPSTATPLFCCPSFRTWFASRQLQLSPRTGSTRRACRRCGLCLAGALTTGARWVAAQPKHPWTCTHQLGGGPSHLGLQTGLHHRVGLATHHRQQVKLDRQPC